MHGSDTSPKLSVSMADQSHKNPLKGSVRVKVTSDFYIKNLMQR